MKEYLAGSTLLFASFTLAGQTDVYLNELRLKFTENSELCLDEHKWPQFGLKSVRAMDDFTAECAGFRRFYQCDY